MPQTASKQAKEINHEQNSTKFDRCSTSSSGGRWITSYIGSGRFATQVWIADYESWLKKLKAESDPVAFQRFLESQDSNLAPSVAPDNTRSVKQQELLQQEVSSYLDKSADLSAPHRPQTNNGPWFQYTQAHFMTELKLSPCALLLYHWTLLRAPAGCLIDADLHDFQAMTAEHRRGKAYSIKQIRRAISELEKLHLVVVKSEHFKMLARHPGPVVNYKHPRQVEARDINVHARDINVHAER